MLTIGIAAVVALLAILYVMGPLTGHEALPPLIDDDNPLNDLMRRKDIALRAIKELEFDHQTGKLSDEDFAREDAILRRQAIAFYTQIEKRAPELAALDERLEAEIAAHRQQRPVAPRVAEAAAAAFCHQCGRPTQDGDRFCRNCGAKIED